MRIGMVSALSVLLPSIYSPRPAAAQFNPPSGPQSVRQDEFKPAGGGLRVKQVSSTPEQALDSTLVTLKEVRAWQSHLLCEGFVRVEVDEPPRSQNRCGKQNGKLSFLDHFM